MCPGSCVSVKLDHLFRHKINHPLTTSYPSTSAQTRGWSHFKPYKNFIPSYKNILDPKQTTCTTTRPSHAQRWGKQKQKNRKHHTKHKSCQSDTSLVLMLAFLASLHLTHRDFLPSLTCLPLPGMGLVTRPLQQTSAATLACLVRPVWKRAHHSWSSASCSWVSVGTLAT